MLSGNPPLPGLGVPDTTLFEQKEPSCFVPSVSDNVTRVEWGQNEITGFAVETLSSTPSLCEAAGGTWANDACTTVACD